MLTLIHVRHFLVSFPNTISVHLWVISVVCFQFSSCPYRRESFGCEVSLPPISAAPNGEQRFSSTAFQTSVCLLPVRYVRLNYACPLGRGAGSWTGPDWPAQTSLGSSAGAVHRVAAQRPLRRTSSCFCVLWVHEDTEFSSVFSADGDTGSDSRDGLSKVVSSVRADRVDTPRISPLRAGNVEGRHFNHITINLCSGPGNVLILHYVHDLI